MPVKTKFIFKALIIAAAAALFFYAALSSVLLFFSMQHALTARSNADEVLSALQSRSFERAFNEIGLLHEELTAAQNLQHYSAWMAYLPFVGTEYRFYRDLLNAGQQLSQSALSVTDKLVQANIGQQFSLESLDLATAPAAYLEVHADILSALNSLSSAAAEAENLHLQLLPENQRQAAAALIDQLRDANTLITEYRPLIESAPFLLGASEPHEILFLLQNVHELRPTGGFIGTIGRLDVREGVISEFYTDDVYNVDVHLQERPDLPAPEPIQQYAGVQHWFLRDANWSPDFPTSAQRAMERYETATSESDLDSVIAVTPFLVQELLRITGPIEVDGIVFNEENLIDAIQFRVEQEFWRIGLSDEERKIVINHLARALKQRIFNLDRDQMRAFFDSFLTALDRKEILVYTTQPELQQYLIQTGWAGQVRPYDADYLFVVDANLGALKTDRLVERFREYTVTQEEDGRWKARLVIRYRNNGFFDYRTTRYRTYTRVYVPLGSQLISSSGFVTADKSSDYVPPTVYEEFGKTVFAGFLSVEPGQERFAVIEYYLADRVSDLMNTQNSYRLLIQKQPGAGQAVREVALHAQNSLFSFAPSTVAYQVEDQTSIRFTDQSQVDKEYILKFQE